MESDIWMNVKPDDRKYDVGDKVAFTDDSGREVPGVVHAVRYQQGRYEWSGAQRPDMHSPEGPDNRSIAGTGEMVLVPGTENERHSFEYIMVHEHEHKAWQQVEKSNQEKLARNTKRNERNQKVVDSFRGSVNKKYPDHPDNFKDMPALESHEPMDPHPELKQHLRIYEDD